MPDPSDNHGFDLNYQTGESWDYNDEFQALEERVPIVDTDGNRSNYTAHADAAFLANDTGDVYIGDGTNWVHHGAIGTDTNQHLADGNIVTVYSGGDLTGDVIDPANTSTPVQNAVDLVEAAGGGRVYLPPTRIQSAGNITISEDNVSLYGIKGQSIIEINAADTDGLIYNASSGNYVVHCNLDGIRIENTAAGSTHDVSTGRAVVDHGRWRCHVGSLELKYWNGNVWETLDSTFGCTHRHLVFDTCDAGGADAIMYFEQYAEPNNIGLFEAMCTDARSGNLSTLIHSRDGTNLTINTIRALDPTPGALVTGFYNALVIHNASWECASNLSSVPDALIDIQGRNVHVQSMQVNPSGNMPQLPYIFRTFTVENSYFCMPRIDQMPDGTLATDESSIVHLRGSGNTDRPIIFQGHRDQVTDDTGDGAYAPLADSMPGTKTDIYIIANGASDPADADANDLIFEEEA